MIIICIRTLILYVVVLFALRVMGKAELSKMSTFQMVVLFMIAELASIPIDEDVYKRQMHSWQAVRKLWLKARRYS